MRQEKPMFSKINRVFFPAYIALCACAAIYYGVRMDWYHFPLSLLAMTMPLLIVLAFKLARARRSSQMDFMILFFILLAYPFGSILEFFQLIPHYDKFCHTLSGAFVSMLALALFLMICPEHRADARKSRARRAFRVLRLDGCSGTLGNQRIFRARGHRTRRAARGADRRGRPRCRT